MITGPATLLMWHSAMAVARTGKEDVTGANRLPHFGKYSRYRGNTVHLI